MESTSLTVVKQGAPVVAIDPNNINYDIAEKWLSTQGGARAFAGEQLSFNGQDGEYRIGFGNAATTFDEIKLVVNVPYLAEAWQDWSGTAPQYPFIALPFAGQALPRRDTLGSHDQSTWQENKFKKGERVDPWKTVLVMVARTESGRLFHFMGSNVTAKNSILALIRDAVADGKRNHGKLPVVKFTSEKIKGEDGNFHVMKCEIIKWVAAEAQDNPGSQMTVSSDETPTDDTEAKTVAKPRTAKPEAQKKQRMLAPVEDNDEEEEEEEVMAAPIKKKSMLQ